MKKVEKDICKMNMLVIDDDCEIGNLIRYMLSRNYPTQEVLYAEDSEKAIAIAKEHNPDIVMIDFHMPILDGAKLARQILQKNSDCNLIFITVETRKEYITKCYDAGARFYVKKPIRFDELFYKIDCIMVELFYKRFDRSKLYI